MQQPVEVSFTLSHKDYLNMLIWHGRVGRLIGLAIYLFVFLGAVIYQTGSMESVVEPIVLGAGLAMTGFIYVLTLAALWWRSKRIFHSDKLMQQEQHFQFTSEHISFHNATGSGHLSWGDVYKVAETSRHFFIYMGKVRSLVIPKANMASDQAVQALRQLLKSKIATGKLRLQG